jgi:aminoglycoside phosphotransferase (APT) family kinase protein
MTTIGLSEADLQKINKGISDRSNVFYWQTDRQITPKETGIIWADRHRYFTDEEIKSHINQFWLDNKITSLIPLDAEASTNLGNVNSVRIAHTEKGHDVIIRLHPKGIQNGYFYVEAEAARQAKMMRLPSYSTYLIHTYTGNDDFSFQVCEKLPGVAVKKWLDIHPEDEKQFVYEIGKLMAQLHTIKVTGFGPFLNDEAEKQKFIGIHKTERDAIHAGLLFNLDVLVKESILKSDNIQKIQELFKTSPLLTCKEPVLVHNDFADWNLLTDGEKITGICDWDECVGGDPIADIACWSTFFNPERLSRFLEGYFSVAVKPQNFDEKFELLRFRYTISKMTLRIRRYSWEQSALIKEKIEVGKQHLALSLKYFNLA